MRTPVLLLAFALTCVDATNYYVSSELGDDAASGTSPDTPWQSLLRAGEVVLTEGDSLLLARNNIWLDDPLELVDPSGATLGAYGNTSLPRPWIEMSRSTAQSVTCVSLQNPNRMTVSDLHVAGCSVGIAFGVTTQTSDFLIEGCFFRDIRSPSQAFSPPNPAWAPAVLFQSAAQGEIYNVTLRNNVALHLDVFFRNVNAFVDGLELVDNTVADCGGNCVGLDFGTNMHLRNSVFLRDVPAGLFLYGTTDVIIGTVKGDNSIEDTDFYSRGEAVGGPDGCAIDFETAATSFLVSGCNIYQSFGGGIMVFGHETTSQDLALSNNTFVRAGCLQPRDDHGGIAFMCPGGHKPSGLVENNNFLTCPGSPAMFDAFPGCSDNVTKKNNYIDDVNVVEPPMPNIEPPSPDSNATSGTFPLVATTKTPNATIRYTLDGSRPTETSEILPAAGVILSWPGPAVAANFRAFHPTMVPSCTNGIVVELNYIMGRAAARPPRSVRSSFDAIDINEQGASIIGWIVDGFLPGGGVPPVQVQVIVNRTQYLAWGLADVDRPDLVKAHVAPNAAHGFSLLLSPNATAVLKGPGKHTVDVKAFGSPGTSPLPVRLNNSPHCVCAGTVCPC